MWNNGAELQYLETLQPFPYGVSPLAIGYNYYKRSQVLQETNKQKHAQLSESVVDSRPAVSMKFWSEEELERARRAELEAFAKLPVEGRQVLETITATVMVDSPIPRPARLKEAIYGYTRSAQLADISLAEYEAHIARNKTNVSVYIWHMDDLRSNQQMALADAAYLRAMSDPSVREKESAVAVKHYENALRAYTLTFLQQWVSDDVRAETYPPGVTVSNIREQPMTEAQLGHLFDRVTAARKDIKTYDHYWEVLEYRAYVNRARIRLLNLGRDLGGVDVDLSPAASSP
jgi:hypothetical protein